MRPTRAAALLLALVALGCVAVVAFARTTHRRADAPQARLMFDDEFNGSQLDHRHWSTCFWWGDRGCTIATNHELEWYEPGQVMVADGTVRLTAAHGTVRTSDRHSYPFVSGMISSGPPPGRRASRFAFRYGRVEARIRVPAGRGLWPGFWLLPADRSDLPEVDVMEFVGQAPNEVELHLHYEGPKGRELVRGTTRRLRATRGGWHVYGIDWEPGRLTWLVDGRALYRVTGAAVPSVPMYLIANLAVGGDGPGPPSAATRFPSAVQIDWVRAWR